MQIEKKFWGAIENERSEVLYSKNEKCEYLRCSFSQFTYNYEKVEVKKC